MGGARARKRVSAHPPPIRRHRYHVRSVPCLLSATKSPLQAFPFYGDRAAVHWPLRVQTEAIGDAPWAASHPGRPWVTSIADVATNISFSHFRFSAIRPRLPWTCYFFSFSPLKSHDHITDDEGQVICHTVAWQSPRMASETQLPSHSIGPADSGRFLRGRRRWGVVTALPSLAPPLSPVTHPRTAPGPEAHVFHVLSGFCLRGDCQSEIFPSQLPVTTSCKSQSLMNIPRKQQPVMPSMDGATVRELGGWGRSRDPRVPGSIR